MAQRYQEIVEGIGEGIIQVDEASLIAYANPAMCAMLGRSLEELLGQPVAQYRADGANASVPARVVDRRRGPDDCSEVAWIGRDGTIVPTRTSEHVLFHVDGSSAGKLSVVTDLTALKISQRIERELASTSPTADRLSQLRYARLFDTTREALLFIDERSLRVLDVNPAATACLGFDAADLRGHTLGDVPMFADAAAKQLVVESIAGRQGEIRFEAVELQNHEGRRFFGDLLGDRYAVDGARIVQLSVRDATERVAALRKVSDIYTLLERSRQNLSEI
ncbi:MAG TPA: PAS domain S-box protein [Candidatus Baltobacteraceae bacterium]|nr:PAS domain S-box protein [Candidatus Baltobacteraceae bacterium]